MTDAVRLYEQMGGIFKLLPSLLTDKLGKIKALIFDWDGVFNNGQKTALEGSGFSEIDSMGINMLRFSLWLKNTGGVRIPSVVITGENNPSAFVFAKREGFDTVYFQTKDKLRAFHHFCSIHNLKPAEIAFFFDDVLDLPLAQLAGLRFQIRRPSGIAFNNLVLEKGLADYASAQDGGSYGLREVCELCMELNQSFEEVVTKRILFDGDYANYIQQRNSVDTVFLKLNNAETFEAAGDLI